MKKSTSKLDWNRMLGFEQVADAREILRDAPSSRMNAKTGVKLGTKVGVKIGVKLGLKAGLKA